MNLTTTYLGMKLRTPLVPSASPLSEDLDKIKQMEQAGASAVVLHSLFEEEAEADTAARREFLVGPKDYLEQIRRAKSGVKIPIIASLNCTTLGGWISYTRQISEAGADALELNIYRIPTELQVTGSTIEETYIDTVRSVRAATKIPLAVKLSPYFSNFANVAQRLDTFNVNGLVLFNRFYQPDIDLEKMEDTKSPGQPRSYKRHLSGTRCDQAGVGRRRCHHVMQRFDASRYHAHPANRNGPGGMAGAARSQIIARAQGHHESAELSRSQRVRTRTICARSFQLHFAISYATVICCRV